ncbi:MAG TPA: hypothetical protein PLC79_10200 [Phycisphaerae bacterium]|nr:hypothetical protein [Phycisphaerae bacterium]
MKRPIRRVRVGCFTNALLTVSTACLVLLCVREAGIDWGARFRNLLHAETMDAMRVVVVNPTLDVNVENPALDVNVENTPLDVSIQR